MSSYLNALQAYDLTTVAWLLLVVCGIFWGLSKSGLKGVATIAVPITAYIFGGKASTGIVVPMLIFADIIAVIYYNRHAQWNHLFRLLPWTLAGIVLGVWIGELMNESAFRKVIAILVIISIILVFWWETRKSSSVPQGWYFSALMGIAAGFSTMIGNTAGPIVTIYLLSMRLPKDQFIGTGAWFFMIINTLKLPMHIFVWHTVSVKSLALNLTLLPIISLGFILGVYLIRRMHDDFYRKLILILTVIASIFLFLRR